MKREAEFEDGTEVADEPVWALLSFERKNRYGSVPGLDDEELADPDELERQVYREYFEPVLMLPKKGRSGQFFASVDESGGIDWGAFGTVDFERTRPQFDKARYKAERLRERREDLLIMIGIIKERLPGKAKYLVLKYLDRGIIGLDHIVNEDMLGLARLYLRVRKLQEEIAGLEHVSRNRSKMRLARVLAE